MKNETLSIENIEKILSLIPNGKRNEFDSKLIEELFDKDENSNVVRGIKCISVDSNNNIVVSDGVSQTVSLLGVTNMIVAVTRDNILVCDKSKNQDIKKIIKLILKVRI